MLALYDIGGTRMRAAATPRPGVITPVGEGPTPTASLAVFVAALRRWLAPGARAAAISIPGGVDPGTGRLRIANIPCLDGVVAHEVLGQALGVPVVLANDADCFALAEAGARAGTVFGVILGTGLGGGIVVDGQILAGAGGLTGEWGHGLAVAGGLPLWPCPCGMVGCLETVGSARGIERLHAHLHGQQAGAEGIVAAWGGGDAAAGATVAAWAGALAGPLAMLMNVLGPVDVPVGGGLGRSALVGYLDGQVRARMLRDPGPGLLRPARLTGEPGLHGAAALGWQVFRR